MIILLLVNCHKKMIISHCTYMEWWWAKWIYKIHSKWNEYIIFAYAVHGLLISITCFLQEMTSACPCASLLYKHISSHSNNRGTKVTETYLNLLFKTKLNAHWYLQYISTRVFYTNGLILAEHLTLLFFPLWAIWF